MATFDRNEARLMCCNILKELKSKFPPYSVSLNRIKFDTNGMKKSAYGDANYVSGLVRINVRMFHESQIKEISDTIRHEIAHIVAADVYGWSIRPHGKEWKYIAKKFGATPKATSKVVHADVANDLYKWKAVYNGEVVARYKRKPRWNPSLAIIKGKPESQGKIKLVKIA